MKIHTTISETREGVHLLRGISLIDLIEKHTFTETVFLLLRGVLPTPSEKKIFDALLVSAVEHGPDVPSIFVPRVSASVGNSIHVAMAAGLLSIGEKHGGAAEEAARIFLKLKPPAEVIESLFAKQKRLPGFGHKIYKDEDPRVKVLERMTVQYLAHSKFFQYARALEKELQEKKGKKLPLNIDGAIAAILMELGFDPGSAKALFALSRSAGMIAHILEEYGREGSFYRLGEDK